MPDDDPFAVLGLVPAPGTGDAEVRAAFLRIAAATHPDRDDGGDPARYAAAAAAYTRLGTAAGRGEAYADVSQAPAGTVPEDPGSVLGGRRGGTVTGGPLSLIARVRRGRPWLLLLRFALGALVCAGCVLVTGWTAATLAIAVLMLTWCVRTGRYDLALCRFRWRMGSAPCCSTGRTSSTRSPSRCTQNCATCSVPCTCAVTRG